MVSMFSTHIPMESSRGGVENSGAGVGGNDFANNFVGDVLFKILTILLTQNGHIFEVYNSVSFEI